MLAVVGELEPGGIVRILSGIEHVAVEGLADLVHLGGKAVGGSGARGLGLGGILIGQVEGALHYGARDEAGEIRITEGRREGRGGTQEEGDQAWGGDRTVEGSRAVNIYDNRRNEPKRDERISEEAAAAYPTQSHVRGNSARSSRL